MHIHEAINKAIEEDKYITQLGFPIFKIKTYPGIPCVIMHRDGSNPKSGWNPTQEELLSDDWAVCE